MAKAMGKSSVKTSAAKKSMATTQEAIDEKYLCYGCGKKQKRSEFYSSTDPFNTVGIIPYCKDCLEKIARNYNNNYNNIVYINGNYNDRLIKAIDAVSTIINNRSYQFWGTYEDNSVHIEMN